MMSSARLKPIIVLGLFLLTLGAAAERVVVCEELYEED